MRKIHLFLAGVSTLAFAAPALAQQTTAPAASVSEVVVTGSRIVRNGNDAPTPVTVASVQQLQAAAPKSLTDALAQLPAFQSMQSTRGGNVASATINNGGTHGNFLNLRGLGTVRTLVLLDGRRVPPTTYGGLVDVDILPEALVKRVEVVTGGASAVYGSDAVSGVVNYILDHDFEGLKVSAQHGVSNYNDGDSSRYGIAAGKKFADGRGHVMVSFEHQTQAPVLQLNRPLNLSSPMFVPTNPNTAVAGAPGSIGNPYKIAFDVVDSARSYFGKFINGPPGVINMAITANGSIRPWDNGLPTGVGGTQIGGDGVTSSPNVDQIGGLHTNQAYGEVSYDVTPDIKASASVAYGQNTAYTDASGISLSGFTFFSGNPFLPAPIQAALTANNTASVGFSNRIQDTFPLHGQEHTKTLNMTAALNGKISDTWRFDAYYTYGKTTLHNFQDGQFLNQHLYAALDAVVDPATGKTVCRTDLTNPGLYPGCVPYNPFVNTTPDGGSAAANAYVSARTEYFATQRLDDFNLSLSGEVGRTWAGPIGVAVGGDYRKNTLSLVSNGDPIVNLPSYTGIRGVPAAAPSKFSLTNQGNLDGKNTVKEAFGEIDVPLAADLPFAKSLDATGAFRYTDYSQSGKINSWKLGFSYVPVEQVRVRGTISRDIRAPVISETNGLNQGVFVFVDPHTNTGTGQVPQLTSGNPNLKPEKGNTKTIGLVYRPDWLPRFSISLDYYDIKITDAIATESVVQELQDCELSNGAASVCSLITRPLPFSNRTPANIPTQVRVVPQNLSTLLTKGVDLEASYNFDLDTIYDRLPGNLGIRLLTTYTPTYNTQFSANSPVLKLAGMTEGEIGSDSRTAVPKWKGQLSFQYRDEGFGLYVGARYIGEFKGGPVFHYDPDHINPVVYFDTTVTYDTHVGGANTEFFFTVNNVFNKTYPLWPTTSLPGIAVPTLPSQYDLMLRYFTLGVRASF